MSLKSNLDQLSEYASSQLKQLKNIENFYERYVKINSFLHSLVAQQLIKNYRILSLNPSIEIEIQPYYSVYPRIEVKLGND